MAIAHEVVLIEIAEGHADRFGGFTIVRNGISETYTFEAAELLVDEAREIAYASGRPLLAVAQSLISDRMRS